MTIKLLTEHYFEFLSLKGGCTGSSESTLGKMPHCWKSHVTAQMIFNSNFHSPPLDYINLPCIIASYAREEGVTGVDRLLLL